jgi:ketosteroid isomerase-like protein
MPMKNRVHSTEEQQIRNCERSRRSAMIEGDVESMSELLDDRLHYRHATGIFEDKDAFLKSFALIRHNTIETEFESVIVTGDAAIVTLAERVRFARGNGPEETINVYGLNVWCRGGDGRWRLLARQAQFQSGQT